MHLLGRWPCIAVDEITIRLVMRTETMTDGRESLPFGWLVVSDQRHGTVRR
jgi:hypothetical protein